MEKKIFFFNNQVDPVGPEIIRISDVIKVSSGHSINVMYRYKRYILKCFVYRAFSYYFCYPEKLSIMLNWSEKSVSKQIQY